MSSPPTQLSRRFFLQGVGGFTLALPPLYSLLSATEARAQAAQPARNFVHFFTEHGSVFGSNMFPADSVVTERRTYAGFEIRRGALPTAATAGNTALSPVLTAPSSVLTPAVVGKMNVLRGLDIPFGIAHYHGGTLGNYASNNGDNPTSQAMRASPRRTLDQILAWSPAFYTSLSGIQQRSLVVCSPSASNDTAISYGYANPASGSGAIQMVGGTEDSLQLFDKLYPTPPVTNGQVRKQIVDRVLENYKRLRNGNKRLSSADKQVLDAYIHRVDELQRRLTTAPPACNSVTRPTESNFQFQDRTANYDVSPSDHVRYFRLVNDVIVAGLQCGLTRIASIHVPSYFHSFSTVAGVNWHEVAHNAPLDISHQSTMVAAKQLFFSGVLMDLVAKLESIPGPSGGTLLDSCLVTWAQEHGNLVHQTQSVPIVMFGGASGALKTGNYCDYRNPNSSIRINDYDGPFEGPNKKFGLTMNQYWGTLLQIFGVPRSEYQEPDHNGYGVRPPASAGLGDCCGTSSGQSYPESVWTVAGDRLPWL